MGYMYFPIGTFWDWSQKKLVFHLVSLTLALTLTLTLPLTLTLTLTPNP